MITKIFVYHHQTCAAYLIMIVLGPTGLIFKIFIKRFQHNSCNKQLVSSQISNFSFLSHHMSPSSTCPYLRLTKTLFSYWLFWLYNILKRSPNLNPNEIRVVGKEKEYGVLMNQLFVKESWWVVSSRSQGQVFLEQVATGRSHLGLIGATRDTSY